MIAPRKLCRCGSASCVCPVVRLLPRWFWFMESLLASTLPVPLGRLNPDGSWTWAPGEPKPRHPITDDFLWHLPGLVVRLPDHRWHDPRVNVTEGDAWGAL